VHLALLVFVSAFSVRPAAALQAQPPRPVAAAPHTGGPAPRLAIQDDDPGSALRVLDSAGDLPFPVAVRVSADRELGPALDTRLAALAQRNVPIWLSVPIAVRIEEADSWREALRRLLDRHGSSLTILELVLAAEPAPVASFVTRIASTEVRASHGGIRLALGGPRMATNESRGIVYTSDLAPYVDLLSLPDATLDSAGAWLARVDPDAGLIVASAPGDENDIPRQMMEAIVRDAGTGLTVHAWPAAPRTAEALRLAVPAAPLLTSDIAELDEGAAALRVSNTSIRRRLLFDNQTFATYFAYWSEAGDAADPLQLSLTLTIEGNPVLHDLLAGTRNPLSEFTRDPSTRQVVARVPVTGRPMLIDFNEGAVDVLADRTAVSAARRLTVAEVIARHQARQRAQDAIVQNYIASARMEQHFRPTVTDPGYDVVTENRYFVAGGPGAPGGEVEWEELSFSVNGSKWGADRPPFPLLQPEKVLSLPLQLRFDEGYRYRLDGTERVDGYDCFIVRFEPTRDDASLYRGTVWIDQKTFARIRVQAVQGRLAAPVVSNEEVQLYAPPVMVSGQPVFLFHGLTARQIMLIAGRNLLVEKSVTFSDFRVNDPEFQQERSEARASDRVMFRETDRGLRYFVKEDGERVVSERATLSAKAMAMGTTLDPSYAFPLPIFGINYLDFEFGTPDSQLALLFAGVLAAGNIQRPGIGPFDASLDFFAIAVPSSDRVYSATGERAGERLLTWPLSTGANLGWQYTPFQKASIQYQFRFDGYVRDRTTTEDFAVPSSTITNGIGGAWEYRRGGYSLVLNGTWFRRASWHEWGLPLTGPADDAPPDLFGQLFSRPTYAKYTASLSRDFYFNVFHKVHLNGAWFGGTDLDRFSQYQFGMFDDTRIHGVPASGVRFEELGMARGSYSLNIFEQYRVDLFLEQAWGRDRRVDSAWQRLSGFGIAVNLRGPRNTILRGDFGKSLLPNRYRNVGSTTLQFMVLKPLGS